MTVAEQLRQEGMQKEAKKVAIGMLKKGVDIDLIEELTDLDRDSILSLKEIH